MVFRMDARAVLRTIGGARLQATLFALHITLYPFPTYLARRDAPLVRSLATKQTGEGRAPVVLSILRRLMTTSRSQSF